MNKIVEETTESAVILLLKDKDFLRSVHADKLQDTLHKALSFRRLVHALILWVWGHRGLYFLMSQLMVFSKFVWEKHETFLVQKGGIEFHGPALDMCIHVLYITSWTSFNSEGI